MSDTHTQTKQREQLRLPRKWEQQLYLLLQDLIYTKLLKDEKRNRFKKAMQLLFLL